MHIQKLWVTQRQLRNAGQIPAMVEAIRNGKLLPKIELGRAEDGSIQVEDGHHRLTAYWLSGRKELEPQDFILVEKDRYRTRFGNIEDLMERVYGAKENNL